MYVAVGGDVYRAVDGAIKVEDERQGVGNNAVVPGGGGVAGDGAAHDLPGCIVYVLGAGLPGVDGAAGVSAVDEGVAVGVGAASAVGRLRIVDCGLLIGCFVRQGYTRLGGGRGSRSGRWF